MCVNVPVRFQTAFPQWDRPSENIMNSKINVELYAFSGGFDRWKGACEYGMRKGSSENGDERVSLKTESQGFQTTSFLFATCSLSRPAGEGGS